MTTLVSLQPCPLIGAKYSAYLNFNISQNREYNRKTQNIVTRAKWLQAHRELMEKEKAHARMKDEITSAHQAFPRLKLEKDYQFQTDVWVQLFL